MNKLFELILILWITMKLLGMKSRNGSAQIGYIINECRTFQDMFDELNFI